MGNLRPAYPGGGVITATDEDSDVIELGSCQGFWVLSDGPAWMRVFPAGTGNEATLPLTITNATPIGAGLYGPFTRAGMDKYLHVAGRGGTPAITVTLV